MNRTYEEQRTAAEKIEDEEIKTKILAGLEVLREQYGEEWVEHINVVALDLSSSTRCILGQLEQVKGEGGCYSEALQRIDGDVEADPSRYGFDEGYGDASYSELTDAWVAVAGLEAEREAAEEAWRL